MPLRRYNSIDQFSFHRTLEEADGINLVFFTKSGCASCGHWKRLLESLLAKRLDLRVFEVNAERDQALAREFEVFHLPSLFLFRAGQFYGELQCEAKLETLTAAIDEALARPAQEMP